MRRTVDKHCDSRLNIAVVVKNIFIRIVEDIAHILYHGKAFFALLMLFTVNTLVLRLTNNALYVPSVTFLGGSSTAPFELSINFGNYSVFILLF